MDKNYTEPQPTQEAPVNDSSGAAMEQAEFWARRAVGSWGSQNPVVHPQTAEIVASWWQEGFNGFAQFASGKLTPLLGAEIDEEIDELRGPVPLDHETRESMTALRALRAYVNACTVQVWRIEFIDDALSPAVSRPDVVGRALDSGDARATLLTLLDEWKDVEFPTCVCEADSGELCIGCSFEADARAWVAGEFPHGWFSPDLEDRVSRPLWRVRTFTGLYGDEFPPAVSR